MNEIAAETLDKINVARTMVDSDQVNILLELIESLHDRVTDLENEKAEDD